MVNRSRRGIVLLEVVVALAIIVVAAIAATVLLYRQAADIRALYEERVAWEIATGRLEELEASGWNETPARAPMPGGENLPNAAVTETLATGDGVRRATVVVAWDDHRGFRRSVTASTIAGGAP